MTRPSREAAAHISMAAAVEAINLADIHLQLARKDYAASDLPAGIRRARVAALDAKLAALRDIRPDHTAYPWSEDQ